MRTIAVDPLAPEPYAIEAAGQVLRDGGLIAFPTETFYGLGADPWNGDALQDLFMAKGRPESMPILLLMADEGQAGDAAHRTPASFQVLARRFWPGPLTLVVEARPSLPEGVTAGTGTVGLRVPSAAIPRAVAKFHGRPITGTSANRTGHPPPRSARDVAAALGSSGIGVILDGGDAPGGVPSTIVDLTGAQPRLIREGVVPFDAVLAALGAGI